MPRSLPLALLSVCGWLAATALGADESPPRNEASIDFSAFAGSGLKNSGVGLGNQSGTTVNLAWFQRESLGRPGLYWSWGLRADVYSFENPGGFALRRLQDFGATIALEYFVGAEPAAKLSISPGLFFENHPSSAAWDVPIDLVAGVPVTKSLDGVFGFSAARFYHRTVPVVGFVWTVNPQWRLEAVYPEPSLVWTLSKTLEARLGGELEGAGFRTDARPVRRTVEYFGYRVGLKVTGRIASGWKISAAGGYEVSRQFDFFHEQQKVQASGAPFLKLGLEFAR